MNETQERKSKRFLFSLRFSILFVFISLFVVITLAIISIRSVMFYNEITTTSSVMMRYVSDSVLRQLTNAVKPLEHAGIFSANLLQSGVLTDSETQLVPYTYNQVKSMPLVRGAYWGDEQGNFVYSRRNPDDSIESDIMSRNTKPPIYLQIFRDKQGNIIRKQYSKDFSYDNRTRPWYQMAKKARKSIWTDVYTFYPTEGLGISTATPVFAADGSVRGVFGVDVSLDELTQFISEQKVSPNGYSFIITRDENLIAYPHREPFTLASERSQYLLNVHKVELPFIDNAMDTYKKTGKFSQIVQYNGRNYIITFEPVFALSPQNWLIGVVTPTSDLVGFLNRMNFYTVVISLVLLTLGIIIVLNLVSRIVSPIHLLLREIDNIRHFELEGNLSIISRIKEVVQLKNAVRAMKRGLKQFETYVPKTLVRQLIESGKEIRAGGERKELVVLFSDIQNFTSISERMNPNQLMEHVCEYFEVLSHIILEDRGTIDKYIGDSIMAFWGAPLTEAEPWYLAAHAGLKIQEKMQELNEKWKREGKPRMDTRIGIHMGDAVVGNLGSSERLNYTAIGDTVNITSRLEHVNKRYKTKIIVSEAVYKLIKDKFVLRLVDSVVIKGRTEAISIYELLGDDRAKMKFDVAAYEVEFARGFTAYKLKEWDEAEMYFRRCIEIYPEDSLAPLFIARCEVGKANN